MAVDDVTTILTINAATNNTTDRQPSSGTEEMFLASAATETNGAVPDRSPDINLQLIDGTNNDAYYFQNEATGGAARIMASGKFLADNTNYFRVTNKSGPTGDYGFAVIQVG